MTGHASDRGRPAGAAGLGSLVAFIALVAAVAVSGAVFRADGWYRDLLKPAWTPPDVAFPIAWTLLYATIAVAGWLLWQARARPGASLALGFYALQLGLNAAWSWLFFGLHRIDLALIDVAALWLAVLATTIAFYRVRPWAGLLLLPYLGWVGYAVALNLAIWRLNP